MMPLPSDPSDKVVSAVLDFIGTTERETGTGATFSEVSRTFCRSLGRKPVADVLFDLVAAGVIVEDPTPKRMGPKSARWVRVAPWLIQAPPAS